MAMSIGVARWLSNLNRRTVNLHCEGKHYSTGKTDRSRSVGDLVRSGWRGVDEKTQSRHERSRQCGSSPLHTRGFPNVLCGLSQVCWQHCELSGPKSGSDCYGVAVERIRQGAVAFRQSPNPCVAILSPVQKSYPFFRYSLMYVRDGQISLVEDVFIVVSVPGPGIRIRVAVIGPER